MNTPKKILLSSLVMLLPACVAAPGYHERAVVYGPGVYATLPAGYTGSYYWYGGRYYYGGRYHTHRYYHNGHYYYGGRYYEGR